MCNKTFTINLGGIYFTAPCSHLTAMLGKQFCQDVIIHDPETATVPVAFGAVIDHVEPAPAPVTQ